MSHKLTVAPISTILDKSERPGIYQRERGSIRPGAALQGVLGGPFDLKQKKLAKKRRDGTYNHTDERYGEQDIEHHFPIFRKQINSAQHNHISNKKTDSAVPQKLKVMYQKGTGPCLSDTPV